MDLDSESKLSSLISQLLSPNKTDSENISLMIQIVSVVGSMDLELQPKPQSELMSLVTQAIFVFNSMDLESQPEKLREFISLISQKLSQVNSVDTDSEPKLNSEIMSLYYEILKLISKHELISIIHQIVYLFMFNEGEPDWEIVSLLYETKRVDTDDFEPEMKLKSLFCQLLSFMSTITELTESKIEMMLRLMSIISYVSQITSQFNSMDFDLQPKPESEFMSLITRMISVANSIVDSDPQWEIVSLVNQMIPLTISIDLKQRPPRQLTPLITQITSYIYSIGVPERELDSLIVDIVCFVNTMNLDTEPEEEWEPDLLISLSPQYKVQLVQGKIQLTKKVERKIKAKGQCHPRHRYKVYLAGAKEANHFHCKDCNGEDHEICEKTPIEVKQFLHPKHPLKLVSQRSYIIETRKCFCCEEDLEKMFYYCAPCDYAMNIACAGKPPILAIDHPKWHEHKLALFPRQAFLTCNVCALADASSPIYMCPPCDFVVHLRCIDLPRVIRISRHPHRISFTRDFDDEGDWSCGICRKIIDNDFGGYSCGKDGCLYAAHSRCATQTNVWDGIELEGVPEDIEEEEVEPFVTISDGIIQHFSHQQHFLRLEKNMHGDYDDNKQCQACITPIYFGNFYSCMQCTFILHEECACLSRKIHHPIHPHVLTLLGEHDGVIRYVDKCSACPWLCIAGFFYECGKEGCNFKLHVQCATISEPLLHGSHMHPLFLTSKPGERRTCLVCKDSRLEYTNETFNCIECNFALCFKCATLPQKVRYKHDKHVLVLSYGKETSTMTYWCEVCEGKVNSKERFYMCDEYCCVTLHVDCFIGKDLYMKPGSSCVFTDGTKLDVLPNIRMSRPFCHVCKKRCQYKTVFLSLYLKFCSTKCITHAQ